ncbi:hypothetical protein FRB97_001190 [Tulasnella sp. 331]|nr:hypothetical protein FRB97_001190 [Tulasnella sp. 331]
MKSASIQSFAARFDPIDLVIGSSEKRDTGAQHHLRDAAHAQFSQEQLTAAISPGSLNVEHPLPSTTRILVCIKSTPG